MPNTPVLSVPIPPRCFYRVDPSDWRGCGELAAWSRFTSAGFPQGHYCDRHRLPTDQAIASELLIHRVSITAELVFAGVDYASAVARFEALDRAAEAIAAVGGLFSLVDVSSITARVPHQAPPGEAIDQGGAGLGRGVRH